MSKKQRERKAKKLAQKPQGAAPLPYIGEDIFTGPISPQAQRVLNRMADTEEVPEERAIQWILKSVALRDEDEFWDFHLDDAQTARALDRVMPRYTARLERAARISKERAREEFDEARIEMIDLVFTRALRRDFLQRFDQMLKRLLAGTETDTLAMALYLRELLRDKRLPWGIVGLVTRIFDESQERAMTSLHQGEELADAFRQARGFQGSAAELLERLKDNPSAQELTQGLKAKPELDAKIHEHVDAMLSGFEQELAKGVYDFEVFTPEEAAQTIRALARDNNENNIDPETADPEFMLERTDEFITQALQEILTPKRLAEIEQTLQDKLEDWQRSQHPRTVALKTEIESLREDPPAENPFLDALYRNAMLKLTHQLHQLGTKLEQAENTAEPPAPSLRDRVRGTFKRIH